LSHGLRETEVSVARRRGDWWLALGVFVLGGCASAPRGDSIEMEAMHFAVIDGPGGRRVEALDPETLFIEGNRAFEAQDFAQAADKYAMIVDRFPGSRWERVATFNAGLALEKDKRFADAVPRFEALVRDVAGSKDAQDALFRIAACEEAMQDWSGMHASVEEILRPHFPGLGVGDRIAALALRGRAWEGRGELALAERDYRAALELYQKNLELRGLDKSPQFRIGEIYKDLFASIRFKLPLERMARDLEDKSNFFLMAQSAYLRALRLQHADWAVVAGFQLGALYEQMYIDMLAAEVPSDLTEEELGIYNEELKKKVRPLLVRAIDIFERNLRLGQRFGKRDDWMAKTEASLARLNDMLRAESRASGEPGKAPVTP
jgi:tetratricopeptide (TPR) repeat protein